MKRMCFAITLSIAAISPADANDPAPAKPEASARSSLGQGYLKPQSLPDSLLILPPPPPTGSSAQARDEEASKSALDLRGGPRWALAAADAEIISPAATGAMSCAAGIVIGEKETPAIHKLLRRSTADIGLSSYSAKRKYQRPRPFMVNNQPSCTPDWEPMLRKDGSYPSGHSAVGFGWALILAEILPDRAAQLVARGRAYGDSRRVCNAHWLSDVEEGRVAAAAVVARLHAEPAFQKDLKAAKKEFKSLGAQSPAPDCGKEQEALGTTR